MGGEAQSAPGKGAGRGRDHASLPATFPAAPSTQLQVGGSAGRVRFGSLHGRLGLWAVSRLPCRRPTGWPHCSSRFCPRVAAYYCPQYCPLLFYSHLGLAFQLVDDIMDFTVSAAGAGRGGAQLPLSAATCVAPRALDVLAQF